MNDVHWLAGLLEGEGSFVVRHTWHPRKPIQYHSPRIQVSMLDGDVIKRVAKILGTNSTIGTKCPGGRTTVAYANGDLAVSWMMTLYPLMGMRRRAKIQ